MKESDKNILMQKNKTIRTEWFSQSWLRRFSGLMAGPSATPPSGVNRDP